MGEHFLFNEDLISWSVSWQEIVAADPTMKFHAVLCDPPYLIKFMNKSWDAADDPIATAEQWGQAIMPLLFPGAIVLMFAGTRGWHWLAVGMEKAGFELWDTCIWMYGSGFPKGQDIGKMTLKHAGIPPDEVRAASGVGFMNAEGLGGWNPTKHQYVYNQKTAWSGHKTPALKPAYEPILCFKAPSGGKTYAELAMEYGSGAINVDGCRIPANPRDMKEFERLKGFNNTRSIGGRGILGGGEIMDRTTYDGSSGRYPANLILDEEAGQLLDQMVGTTKSGKMKAGTKRKNRSGWAGDMPEETGAETIGDSGGPSRFFYCAKASKSEREAGLDDMPTKAFAYSNGAKAAMARGEDYEAAEMDVNKVKQRRNTHPTVKPLSLCKYLATLILPPDCVQPRRLLVPFAGTGSECIGALQAGWDEIYGIERESEYIEIAEHRVEHWANKLVETKE